MLVSKAYRLKLYPSAEQRSALIRIGGCCRWLWNHLLELQQKTYAAEQKFVFRFDMDKMLPSLKAGHDWLGEAPSGSLQRVCRNLDQALKQSFRSGKGFPRFKSRFNRRSFYIANSTLRFSGSTVILPKLGAVRFRAGRLPASKILGATVSLEGDAWYCTIQCEVEVSTPTTTPAATTVIGLDVGLSTLAVMSDGTRVPAPKTERRRAARVKRLQQRLSRCQRGSANREKARRRQARAQAALAATRRDCRHKLTRSLVGRASAIVIEDLNVKAIARSPRLGRSVGEAGMGEVRRQLTYKAAWAGKALIVADRFFPSTQSCSCCGAVKAGADKLTLAHRTYRCDVCGHVQDRDLSATMNLRRYGLQALNLLDDVGQAMPERMEPGSIDACGDASAGPAASAADRHASLMQESMPMANTIGYE